MTTTHRSTTIEHDRSGDDNFNLGERVVTRGGRQGTVVAVRGILITVKFDLTMQQTFTATNLTKIEKEPKFKAGDRVLARTGDSGTVLSVRGNLAKVLLDSLATKTIAVSFLCPE